MTIKITFLNDPWILPIVIGAVILLAVFFWKEFAQTGRRRLVLKFFLILIAVFSLVIIALKPALPTNETTGKYVLLTEGFDEDQLDSLRKEHRMLEVVEYNPGRPVPEEFISAEKVFVIGSGIKEYDLWQLDEAPVVYLGKFPNGLIKLKFPEEKVVGDSLFLEGLYRKPVKGNWLILQGPGGGGLDSLMLDTGGDQSFQLTGELKVPGNFVYTLTEKDSLGKILNSDPVPVKVAKKENFKILIINSYPTFETKYLKNFLAESGHELVVRSQITRGRYKFEYFNTDRIPVGSLSQTTLEPFDLLIMDATSWRNLSATQEREVENSVREEGIGVIIQPDDIFFRSPGEMADLGFERVQQSEFSFLQWPGIKINQFPYRIKEGMKIQKIHTGGSSTLSGYTRVGQGRIGTTVLTDTWQLILDGNSEVYRHLWSKIVEESGKIMDLAAEWEQEEIIVYPHEPFHFKVRTSATDPEIRNHEGNIIPLKQEINISSIWNGTTWPKEPGWNRLQMDTISYFEYYIAPENSWGSVNEYQTAETNRKYFKQDEEKGKGVRPLEPVNPIWFYALFLICMGGLWLEPKI